MQKQQGMSFKYSPTISISTSFDRSYNLRNRRRREFVNPKFHVLFPQSGTQNQNNPKEKP